MGVSLNVTWHFSLACFRSLPFSCTLKYAIVKIISGLSVWDLLYLGVHNFFKTAEFFSYKCIEQLFYTVCIFFVYSKNAASCSFNGISEVLNVIFIHLLLDQDSSKSLVFKCKCFFCLIKSVEVFHCDFIDLLNPFPRFLFSCFSGSRKPLSLLSFLCILFLFSFNFLYSLDCQ